MLCVLLRAERHVEVHDAFGLSEAKARVHGLAQGVLKLGVRRQFGAATSLRPSAAAAALMVAVNWMRFTVGMRFSSGVG
jgi:hypothetical protein